MKLPPLLSRIVIGTILATAVFLVVMFAPVPVLCLLVAAWSVLATLEFLKLLRAAEIHLNPWLLGSLNVLTVAAAWLDWLPGFLIVPFAAVLIHSVLVSETRPRVPVYGTFVCLYFGFLPAHFVMLGRFAESRSLSHWLVMFPLLLTWTNDTFAWLFGRLLGRHRLMPDLSPRKTWEGFLFGLLFAAALAVPVLGRLAPFSFRPWPFLAVIGVGLGVLSQIGDLFESVFKRAVGIKHSSAVLGEHGGFMDRVDSLLFTIPAWYYLVLLYA